ncbi:hypothetical protein TorRG33x02_285810 [Trema orientale]|uniref:Uncharacterized protein n=1 Tax=Trema orientale TaxID=63057 RepID=A0A2P5CGC5_TREOI|nr:hypothetical protein TorRG33x02_285810 [Trema orientale]
MVDEILGHHDLFSFHKKHDNKAFSGGIIESTSNSSNLRNPKISFAKVVGNFNANSLNSGFKLPNGVVDGSKSPLIDHSNDVTTASQPTLKGNYVCVKVNEKLLKDRLNLC